MSKSLKTRTAAFSIHLSISIIVIVAFYSLVLLIWYPAPYYYTEGVEQGIIILLGIYLILGSVLTFILFKPGKKGLLNGNVI